MRPRRPGLLGALVAALATLATAVALPTSAGASSGHLAVRYAVAHPACKAPRSGHKSCFAVRWAPATRTTKGAQRVVSPAAGNGPGGGYSPAQLAAAYGYDPAGPVGATQTVAIVDAYDDPYAEAELAAFDSHYGFPAETSTSFRKVNQNGSTSSYPVANSGWAEEIALDIEAVRAVCLRCRILLVEANSASSDDLAAAVNTAARLGATEISNSYGGGEVAGEPASITAAYDHPGVVITAAAGDDGWYDWDLANAGNDASDNGPETPAAYPTVVGVGGTELTVDGSGNRTSETVWNDNGSADSLGVADNGSWLGSQGATGSGCSSVYSAEPWQAQAASYADTGCGAYRQSVDVAADAAPGTGFSVYTQYGGGWAKFGGTSLASPLVASMWALAGGAGGVAYPAQSLYDHLNYAPGSLFDVTAGANGFCGGADTTTCSARVATITSARTTTPNDLYNSNPFYFGGWAGALDCGYDLLGAVTTTAANTQCTASAGYDGPSGVGTPSGLAAFRRMGPTVRMAGPSLIRPAHAAGFTATGFTDNIPAATAATYRWSWGDGTTTPTTSAATTHTWQTRGTYSVRLTVTDSTGHRYTTAARRYVLGYTPLASIAGRTRIRHGTAHTWVAKVAERNSGGRITRRTWLIGGRVVGHASTFRHRFVKGIRRLRLVVRDDSGMTASRTIKITVH